MRVMQTNEWYCIDMIIITKCSDNIELKLTASKSPFSSTVLKFGERISTLATTKIN